MKTSSAKQKGRKLQQWVRDRIIYYFPKLSLNDVRSVSMGCSGEDVQLSEVARSMCPYAIECKNVERFHMWDAYDQATMNSTITLEPLVVIKKNGKKPLVIIDADKFFKLIGDINDYKT